MSADDLLGADRADPEKTRRSPSPDTMGSERRIAGDANTDAFCSSKQGSRRRPATVRAACLPLYRWHRLATLLTESQTHILQIEMHYEMTRLKTQSYVRQTIGIDGRMKVRKRDASVMIRQRRGQK